jgi:hypothetical protein
LVVFVAHDGDEDVAYWANRSDEEAEIHEMNTGIEIYEMVVMMN